MNLGSQLFLEPLPVRRPEETHVPLELYLEDPFTQTGSFNSSLKGTRRSYEGSIGFRVHGSMYPK